MRGQCPRYCLGWNQTAPCKPSVGAGRAAGSLAPCRVWGTRSGFSGAMAHPLRLARRPRPLHRVSTINREAPGRPRCPPPPSGSRGHLGKVWQARTAPRGLPAWFRTGGCGAGESPAPSGWFLSRTPRPGEGRCSVWVSCGGLRHTPVNE